MTESKLLFNHLHQRHPRFYYHSYSVRLEEKTLKFRFNLEIEPNIHFSPEVEIQDVDHERLSRAGKEVINNIAFHLGLMEIPSYWKATCSPEIVIRAGTMDDYQVLWWKELLFRGLGEFFYVNNIDFTTPDLITFKVGINDHPRTEIYDGQPANSGLLSSMGGGKDSAVTYELLKKAGKGITCWCLNPTRAMMETIRAGRAGGPIIVRRKIDDNLLELNRKGYLNGHTPFSAYLAFLSVACAILFDFKTIVASNERSSNEGNVNLHGMEINHQYSKSFDFEKRFRDYSRRYLARGIDYFSLLRPLYELQIARIFSGFPHYFPFFRSCNKGQKADSWCHGCAKCLFVFTILYPFVEDHVLMNRIFSKNLFEMDDLVGTALDLLDHGRVKPFECVGSREETLVAFYLCIKETRERGRALPVVLRAVAERIVDREQGMEARAHTILHSWNEQHAIPRDIEEALRSYIKSNHRLHRSLQI